MKNVKLYKQERGMTQIKEQLAPTATTTTNDELWRQVEQPTNKLSFSAVMMEDSKKEQQQDDLRRSKRKIARIQLRWKASYEYWGMITTKLDMKCRDSRILICE